MNPPSEPDDPDILVATLRLLFRGKSTREAAKVLNEALGEPDSLELIARMCQAHPLIERTQASTEMAQSLWYAEERWAPRKLVSRQEVNYRTLPPHTDADRTPLGDYIVKHQPRWRP